MMVSELLERLKRLKVETKSLACMGCGYEHNCGIHGCRIIREAVQVIECLVKELEICRAEREALYNLAKNHPREEREA